MKKKIVIIKLGAKGDVVRTLSLLLGIKEKYPNSEITWITKPNALEIIEQSPYVDKVFTLPYKPVEEFDILYNFDVDSDATSLANGISAKEKYGFYSEDDFPAAFNFPAEYYLNTLFDDELKKSNKKTYQEMMFKAAELPYNKQHHPIQLKEQHKKYADDFILENNINSDKLVGIHLGASPRWPSKKWHPNNLKEFVREIAKQGKEVLLFAGPNEPKEQEEIFRELKDEGIKIHKNNPVNSDLEFASLVDQCSSMICSDSLAMHVALALKKPTIGLFFCTSPHEVEDYSGLLKKVVSPNLMEFFPHKMDQYSENLVKSISAEEVSKALESLDRDE